jgi:glycosyltransferase involved in cell wall biosynthesis
LRLLFFGTYDARRHPRVEVLMEGFRSYGDEVVECNVPLDLDTAARVRLAKEPWRVPGFLARLAVAWARLLVESRRVGRVDAVVVGYLGAFDIRLARLRWPRKVVVLDHLVSLSGTAADRSAGGGRVQSLLARADAGAARAADLVVVDTEEQRADVLAVPRDGVVVVPVGAPAWWFPDAPRDLPPAPLRVVFFGLYTPLQGAPVIARAMAALGEDAPVTLTMVGTGQDLPEVRQILRTDRRVEWVDWLPPALLAARVAEHHVCLGVFGTGPKALRVVPNKVFQGAAAGCAVVTSDTPPQRAALGDAAAYVPPGDPAALAAVLTALSNDPARVAALREAAYRSANERFRAAAVVRPLRDRLAAR